MGKHHQQQQQHHTFNSSRKDKVNREFLKGLAIGLSASIIILGMKILKNA